MLHNFAQGYDVDLIAFQHPGQKIVEALPPGLVRETSVVELRHHANGLVAKASRNASRLVRGKPPLIDRFSGYEAEIEAKLRGRFYDVAVLEHIWTGAYLGLFRRFAELLVLDLHNVESAWHASSANTARFPHAAIHRSFGKSAAQLERLWLPLADIVLVTSEQDAERARALAPASRISVYPNAIPHREPPVREPDFAIAFSGNLEYEPNRDGLRWFIQEVWPALKRRFSGLELLLIGKNEHALPPALRSAPSVTCTGWVADPFESLGSARLCIAPLRSGSGTRLKIIEAWAAERAVVSTSIGAEGLGAKDQDSILIADRPGDFADAVGRLLIDHALRQKIATNGRKIFQQKYTWNVAWKTLPECLQAGFNRERVRL